MTNYEKIFLKNFENLTKSRRVIMSFVSRKGFDLANRSSVPLSTAVENYSSKKNAKEYEVISLNYRIYIQYQRNSYIRISNCINEAAAKVFYFLQASFYKTEVFRFCWEILHSLPKNYGNIKKTTPALQGISPLEQMMALDYWFYNGKHSIRENQYTFCFSNNSNRLKGRLLPLSIKKGATSMMEVKLGNRSYEYLALKYDDGSTTCMAVHDPWEDKRTENFVYHLEALEIVRQPQLIGATLIKGNAFESDYINQDWRYGATGREACVEICKQRHLSKKNQAIRAESAAYNLLKLINIDFGDVDLCDHIRNPIVYVTSNDILHAYQIGTEKLCLLMLKLMTAKLGPFSIKLQELVDRALLGDVTFN